MCKPLTDSIKKLKAEIAELSAKKNRIAAEKDDLPEIPNLIGIDEAIEINKSAQSMRDELTEIESENEVHRTKEANFNNERESITSLIDKATQKVTAAIPSITVDDALEYESQKKLLKQSIEDLNKQIKTANDQQNPYIESQNMLLDQEKNAKQRIIQATATRDKLDTLFAHLSYIRAAYKDRKRIKKFILSNLIPILNKRIQYYLEAFDCEFAMEFTPTLSILPSKWDYTLCSGGERKRIDMAVMFALYDLYIYMHGQQCNIMVLDEIDGRLDSEGIESFIDIINNDFCGESETKPKPSTILVISHRPEMLDAFPSKILVKKRQGFSFIESVI
jgi:DNA repair exonuclease SbcCD ATPase subunit